MVGGEFIVAGSPAMDWHPIQEGVEILSVASCYRNQRSATACWATWLEQDRFIRSPGRQRLVFTSARALVLETCADTECAVK